MCLLVAAVLTLAKQAAPDPPPVEVRLVRGEFMPTRVHIPRHGSLRLVNAGDTPYIVEGAGAIPGDVVVPPHEQRVVPLLNTPGRFYAIVEENPSSELTLDLDGDPSAPKPAGETPFDAARVVHRQPLILEPGREPAYAAYTAFDIVGSGETAQQGVLRDLYQAQEALSGDHPPEEFRLFFTDADWRGFRESISMVYALGPGAYDRTRFGPRIAAAKPDELHPVGYAVALGVPKSGQRDVLVRICSDRHWFNLRAVRWIWRLLGKRVRHATMESGYANPNGRSPILGGFFDGTGNPYGDRREATVFGRHHANGAYLALFRIRFDEARFRSHPLATQQALIGRERLAGRPLRNSDPRSHKNRAGLKPEVSILRQPYVFDDGLNETGLLFASLQASPKALDTILRGFMLGPKARKPAQGVDRFLDYMRFEEAALYYAPSSPRGSFPGSLRFGGR